MRFAVVYRVFNTLYRLDQKTGYFGATFYRLN